MVIDAETKIYSAIEKLGPSLRIEEGPSRLSLQVTTDFSGPKSYFMFAVFVTIISDQTCVQTWGEEGRLFTGKIQ